MGWLDARGVSVPSLSTPADVPHVNARLVHPPGDRASLARLVADPCLPTCPLYHAGRAVARRRSPCQGPWPGSPRSPPLPVQPGPLQGATFGGLAGAYSGPLPVHSVGAPGRLGLSLFSKIFPGNFLRSFCSSIVARLGFLSDCHCQHLRVYKKSYFALYSIFTSRAPEFSF